MSVKSKASKSASKKTTKKLSRQEATELNNEINRTVVEYLHSEHSPLGQKTVKNIVAACRALCEYERKPGSIKLAT